MSRAERRWFGRGRTRALLSLGILSGLGAVGTSAYWTDGQVVPGVRVTAGFLDLRLATPVAGTGAVGPGTPHVATEIAVADLTPGERHAFAVSATNAGHADVRLAATVARGATWTFVGSQQAAPVTVELHWGGTPTEDTSFPVQEGCGAGQALTAGPVAVEATPSSLVAAPRRLAAGATQPLCLVVGMAPSAASENQGRSGTLRLDLTADQVAR